MANTTETISNSANDAEIPQKTQTPKKPELPKVVDNSAQESEARTRRLKALGYV